MDIDGATLFKRKKTAVAVAGTLGDRFVIEEVKIGRGKRVVRPRRSEMPPSDPAKGRSRPISDVRAERHR